MENSLLNMLPFDPAYGLIGILAVELILLILIIVALCKCGNLKKRYEGFMTGKEAASLEEIIQSEIADIHELKENDMALERCFQQLYKVVDGCYQKVGVEKYNALNMGGQVSFAYCILNKDNDGVLMNSIHTREGSYLYMKEIKNGSCEVILGKEEQQALIKAMSVEVKY